MIAPLRFSSISQIYKLRLWSCFCCHVAGSQRPCVATDVQMFSYVRLALTGIYVGRTMSSLISDVDSLRSPICT